jgi:hypothetical protein
MENTAMTLAQQFRQEDRQEGELNLIHRQLARKFPGIAAQVKPQIAQMDEERLFAFGEALLFLQSEQECLD